MPTAKKADQAVFMRRPTASIRLRFMLLSIRWMDCDLLLYRVAANLEARSEYDRSRGRRVHEVPRQLSD
jgi:hypothetical protein